MMSSADNRSDEWSFSVSLQEESNCSIAVECSSVPQHVRESFHQDGFAVFHQVLSPAHVDALNDRLEEILRGRYDRGREPDKTPRLLKNEHQRHNVAAVADTSGMKTATNPSSHPDNEQKVNNKPIKKKAAAVGPLGFSGNFQNVKVLQVINVHKADTLFRRLACNEVLGKVVSELAGWKQGARLAQDQVWAKPPGAPALAFHRDSPYFMFDPGDVVTVWVALDDMDSDIGPLEYVRGSHQWGQGRVGSASHFFQGGKSLLKSAAEREGVDELDVVSMAGLRAGSMSIHDGRTWHGSGKNESKTRPRRGLGLHFVPAEVRFTDEAKKSSLWKRYVTESNNVASVELSEEEFPITWKPDSV